MSAINDPATRRRLAELHATYVAASRAIVDAREAFEELRSRERALKQRIAAEVTSRSAATASSVGELSDALAADPTANFDAGEMDAAVEAQVAAHRDDLAHRARVGVIQAAIDKLASPIAAAETLIVVREQEEEAARRLLANACHGALVAEFKARWKALTAEVMEPMFALALDPGVVANVDHLDSRSFVRLRSWSYNPALGGKWIDEELLRLDGPGQTKREMAAAAVAEQFLSSLASKR